MHRFRTHTLAASWSKDNNIRGAIDGSALKFWSILNLRETRVEMMDDKSAETTSKIFPYLTLCITQIGYEILESPCLGCHGALWNVTIPGLNAIEAMTALRGGTVCLNWVIWLD